MMIHVHVKKIAPDYKDGYSSEPQLLDPDHWLQFLEYQQVKHFPECTKKELFKKKLKEDQRANRRKAFAPILYK
jgi:hypothetical protein